MVGAQKTIKDHKLVSILKKHSSIVQFILALRTKWMIWNADKSPNYRPGIWAAVHWPSKTFTYLKVFQIFPKYKDVFNGIDGHALFIGTVLHSLDHYLMQKNTDPLMFDIDCEKYGKMNEILRFVRSSFVEKPPGIIFRHMYKGTRDPRTTIFKAIFEFLIERCRSSLLCWSLSRSSQIKSWIC